MELSVRKSSKLILPKSKDPLLGVRASGTGEGVVLTAEGEGDRDPNENEEVFEACVGVRGGVVR